MSAPPLRRRLCIAYGAGSVGAGIFSTIPGLLLLFYLTDTLAVPAGLAGLAVLVPKLWDIITDPIVGAWSDRTSSRWGRRRPFLLAGALTLPPCFVALVGAQVGLLGVGFAGLQVFPFAMLPELIDVDAQATGLRREGVFTALWFIGEKGGFAAGAWLLSGVLAATGFLERRAGELVVQPDTALLGIHLSMAIIPAALALLSLPLLLHHVEPPRTESPS